jgi:hypothetical protein
VHAKNKNYWKSGLDVIKGVNEPEPKGKAPEG